MLSGGNFKRFPEGVETHEGIPISVLHSWMKFIQAKDAGDALATKLLDDADNEVVSMDVAYAEWLEANGNVSLFNDTSYEEQTRFHPHHTS